MYQLAETQDSRIAHYTFGKSITSNGVTVFGCDKARKGKKVFGNDPDPVKEIMLTTQNDIISGHIKKHKKGKVAGYEKIIREAGQTYQVHHRTVMFGSTWKSDSLKPANHSIIYHNGAHTHFRFPGINRITSLDEGGLIACSGWEDMNATNRKVHFFEENESFTPVGIGSILVAMHDCFYHNVQVKQHFPFYVDSTETVQISVTKPTVILEITQDYPDVAEFTQQWLNQIEKGLIEIVNR